jgi:hypothetical protein
VPLAWVVPLQLVPLDHAVTWNSLPLPFLEVLLLALPFDTYAFGGWIVTSISFEGIVGGSRAPSPQTCHFNAQNPCSSYNINNVENMQNLPPSDDFDDILNNFDGNFHI